MMCVGQITSDGYGKPQFGQPTLVNCDGRDWKTKEFHVWQSAITYAAMHVRMLIDDSIDKGGKGRRLDSIHVACTP